MSADDPHPSYSVIVPAFDGVATIGRTVGSVLAAADVLASDHPGTRTEVIVVDDGSADATLAAARALAAADDRVRVVTQPNSGASAARNTGARLARGRVLAFVDCDDEVLPAWLSTLTATGALLDEVDFVFCEAHAVRPDGTERHWQIDRLRAISGGQRLGMFFPGLFTVHRDLFERCGGYAVALRFSENSELGLRLVARRRLEGPSLATRCVREPLVQVNLPAGPFGSNSYSDQVRLESAVYVADAQATAPDADPHLVAEYWSIAGVAAARLGRGSVATRCFLRAARAERRDPRHAARAAASIVPPLRRHLWPAGR